jgi:branched-chain amino acid transport system substrate-binding protein
MRLCGWIGVGLLGVAGMARAQSGTPAGSEPAMPYANMPSAATPFGGFRKPYQEWYVQPDTLDYHGAARSEADGDAAGLKTIKIGFLGPLDASNPDAAYGVAMLHGAQMALEEANARGGYRGTPFELKVHDDLPLWGASSMEIVKMRWIPRQRILR